MGSFGAIITEGILLLQSFRWYFKLRRNIIRKCARHFKMRQKSYLHIISGISEYDSFFRTGIATEQRWPHTYPSRQ